MSKVGIVCIIDDEAAVREAMQDLVSSFGFIAFSFESAEDFLRSPQADETYCVISDVQMPGMKGYEIQRQIAARGRRVPIILITAFPEKCSRECVEAAGVLAVLEKPVDGKTLVALLRDALASSGEG